MAYHAPATLQDAFAAMARDGASPIAGGTDWFPARGDRITGESLLDVTGLPGFRGIDRVPGGWRIGAATRWTDVIRADLPAAFDGLRAAAREVGSVQIQNAGTIGGNLCNASPAADGVPPLLTLGAEVEIVSPAGARTQGLASFITGVRRTALAPGELLAAIRIPDPGAARAAFVKSGARRYMVISVVMVAALVRAEGGRIAEARLAVGACSPVARRLPALESALAGRALGDWPAITPAHLAPLSPIDDIRASATYRAEAVGELLHRALALATGAA
jgi:CO/xanthine dehydrogenase FAD-binding subunit